MTSRQPDRQGLSIVLLGDFNPKIFQPAWFAGEGLIRPLEAEEAELGLIHPDVVQFSIAWCQIEVLRYRFVVSTAQESSFEPLRDLVIGTFRLLSHTPLRVMGINSDAHYRMPSIEAWHVFGRRLAPQDPWLPWLQEAGLRRLVMQGQRTDGYRGAINVEVQPSLEIHPGVHVSVNDHFDIVDANAACGAGQVIAVLEGEFAAASERARRTFSELMKHHDA